MASRSGRPALTLSRLKQRSAQLRMPTLHSVPLWTLTLHSAQLLRLRSAQLQAPPLRARNARACRRRRYRLRRSPGLSRPRKLCGIIPRETLSAT